MNHNLLLKGADLLKRKEKVKSKLNIIGPEKSAKKIIKDIIDAILSLI